MTGPAGNGRARRGALLIVDRARRAQLSRGRGLGKPDATDEGMALLLVLMCIMIAGALSILALGMVIAQESPTFLLRKSNKAIEAAEAGLDAGLSEIRNATSPNIINGNQVGGDRTKLPCGPLTGQVGGESGNLTYTVTFSYFSSNPANTTTAWRTANKMTCTTGSGTATTPTYALLTAAGNGAAIPNLSSADGNRSLETVYQFKVTNTNVSGGLVHTYPDGANGTLDLCFDAGSASPTAGTQLKMQACSPGSIQQLFAYRTDLSLVLAATQTTAPGSGMCLQAPQPASSSPPTYVVFQPCVSGQPNQEWSFNDVAAFEGADSNGDGGLNGWCFQVETDNTVGSRVKLAQVCGNAYNRDSTWDPDFNVGAGAAGASTQQLVNYQEFGRCFDITSQNVNSPFMIDFPCKQAPPPGTIAFNQKFTYTTSTGWLTSNNGSVYCVTTSPNNGGYVLMVNPCSTTRADQKWVVNGDTGNYATSWTIVDSNGRCLGLGPPGSTLAPLNQWSTIVVQNCNGSLSQKWNAPPNLAPASKQNTRETTGGT
jgi:Tfp pilus assembly protein PilX